MKRKWPLHKVAKLLPALFLVFAFPAGSTAENKQGVETEQGVKKAEGVLSIFLILDKMIPGHPQPRPAVDNTVKFPDELVPHDLKHILLVEDIESESSQDFLDWQKRCFKSQKFHDRYADDYREWKDSCNGLFRFDYLPWLYIVLFMVVIWRLDILKE